MIDSKTIDLIVRAQLEGKSDLNAITKSIKDLEKALESQADAAKKGESSIDQLKATLLSLEQVQRNLKTQASLVGEFQKLPTQIDNATKSVDKAKARYEKLAEEQKKSTQVTEEQSQKLFDLSARYENAQKRLDAFIKRQADLRSQLQALGADTSDLGTFQKQLQETAASLGAVYKKTNESISSYADNVRRARDEQKQLSQAQIAAARDAQAFEAGERRAAAAAEARARAAQEVAEAQRNRASESVAVGRQFDEDAAAAKRARELAQLREDIIRRSNEQIEAEKQLSKNSALAKAADDAQQAARQYTTLARASSDLTPKFVSLRSAVEDILNPTKAATSTLGGLEQRVTGLSKTIGAINGPVKDYRETLASLNDAQRSISQQAGLIDNYQRQVAAVRAAREEFTQARVKVAEYAAAVRQGGESGAQFAQALLQAQAAAQRAAQALQTQLQTTREAREALHTAGIATNDLANSQSRLIASAQQAQNASKALGEAVKQYGLESEKAGNSGRRGIFGDEGRTTLSLAQRIRGEILALTASYVGLQGAISVATDSLAAFNNRAATRTVIGVGLQTTDRAKIDDEYKYIKDQAERIGLVFQETATQYSEFAAAATFAGRPRDEIKFIFESFAEAGRVLGLTQDNLNGVFLALKQIFSKGKIGAEELGQQLGERLPAVFQVAQEALKNQFPDLNKAIAKGQVGAENLVLIAQKYREIVSSQLPGAIDSMAAQQARLTNAIQDFKLAIADAGFADAYTEAIKKITEFLKSPDGKDFAEGMSQAFKAVLDVLLLLVGNFNELKAVIGAVIAIQAVRIFFDMATGLGTVAVAARGAASSLTLVNKAFLILSAAIVGWQIGSYLRDKFKEVQAAGVSLVTGMDIAWTRIKYGAQILFEELPRFAENAFISIENLSTKLTRAMARGFQKFFETIGATDIANVYKEFGDKLIERNYKLQTDKAAALRKEMEAEIGKIKKIQAEMFDDILAGKATAASKQNPTQTSFPGLNSTGKKDGPSEAEIAKRQRAIESIQDRLDALDARINRASSQTLANQLEAVDLGTNALKADIEKLADKGLRDAFLKRLETLKGELKTQVETDFSKTILDAQNALQTKLEQAEAAAGRKSRESLDARLNAISLSYADAFRDIDALIAKQTANNLDTSKTVEIKTKMTSTVDELKQLEAKKFFEEEINRLIRDRQTQIEAVRAAQKAGNIDQDEAAQRINQINAEFVPIITQIKDQATQWAQAHAAIFGDPAALDAFVERMGAIAEKATQTSTEFGLFESRVKDGILDGVNKGLESMFDLLGQLATSQMTVREGFRAMGTAALIFLRDFMRDLLIATIKLAIFNAMKRSPYAPVAAAGHIGAASVQVPHNGGVINGGYARNRLADPSWFSNAPRYHTGGIAGLAPDEYPAILRRNEEVLRESDPRNILNGGASAGGGSPAEQPPVRFVLVDDRSKVAEAMASADGERTIMQILTRNVSTVRQLVR